MKLEEALRIQNRILLYLIIGLLTLISLIPMAQETRMHIAYTVVYLEIILAILLLVECIPCLYRLKERKR